ncbi:MAG: hypothetical protein JWP97_5800 [Labilithrix sp.]|nr:hypothetical protein [Labilithrix sp.]
MKAARRVRVVGILATSVLAVFVTLSACSNNGEGERCQILNGNSDCQDGLVCTSASAAATSEGGTGAGSTIGNGGNGYVNPPYNTSDRCCPSDRKTATHPACTEPNTSVGGEAGIPPADTGPPVDANTSDVGTDTGAPVDAGSDAADADADAP